MKISKLKSDILSDNLLLLTEEEKDCAYSLEKMLAWQEDYSENVEWDEFNHSYLQCPYCSHWDDSPCICYARY
jgi:hypothetical protein